MSYSTVGRPTNQIDVCIFNVIHTLPPVSVRFKAPSFIGHSSHFWEKVSKLHYYMTSTFEQST